MTIITEKSTIAEIANFFGCSTATVVLKAKTLGIKLRGRSDVEHATLVSALTLVTPRPRKEKSKKTGSLQERIGAHFLAGKALIEEIKKELGNMTKQEVDIEVSKKEMGAALASLEREQEKGICE